VACPHRSRWLVAAACSFHWGAGAQCKNGGRAWPEPGGAFAPVAKQARRALGHTHTQSWMHAQGPFLIMTPCCCCCSMAPSLCCASLSGHCSRPRRESRSPAPGGRCLPWEKLKSNGGHRKERKKETKGELAAAGKGCEGREKMDGDFILSRSNLEYSTV
jgi:hypothetical protein